VNLLETRNWQKHFFFKEQFNEDGFLKKKKNQVSRR